MTITTLIRAAPLLSLFSSVSAFTLCPLLGPIYPQPTQLSIDPTFQAATANLTQQLQQISASGTSRWANIATNNTVSFSAGAFSLDTTGLVFDFEWNAPNGTWAPGAQATVNSDTAYGVGSVSKLTTVYTFLHAIGDGCWNEPVSRYVPELAAAASDPSRSNAIQYANWDDITIGDVASQLGGFGRDIAGGGATDPVPGFPPPVTPACNGESNCTRSDFFTTLLQHPPVFASSTTPIYSNNAYTILSYAAENITARPFQDLFQDYLISPLGLANTSFTTPALNKTIISPALLASGAIPDIDQITVGSPPGGAFSTLNDMAAIGRSILNSTLLPSAMTRRWLKPHTHTSNPYYSVGAPWEIRREAVNGRIVDIYGKSGDIPGYNAVILLMPDFNVGAFVAATTSTDDETVIGSEGHDAVAVVANQMTETLLPALEDAARTQALQNFAGTYTNTTSNTTMTISVDAAIPGINITQLTSDSNDDLPLLAGLKGSAALPLQPTNLQSGDQVSFRVIPQLDQQEVNVEGVVSPQCFTWQTVDQDAWNNQGGDDFVFTIDESGRATAVEPLALQQVLTRVA